MNKRRKNEQEKEEDKRRKKTRGGRMNNLINNILKWLASLGKNKSKGAPVVHQRDNYSEVSLMHTTLSCLVKHHTITLDYCHTPNTFT